MRALPMFRDHAQASRAIRLLVADEALDRLLEDTATVQALLLRLEPERHLSPAKRALLLGAWSLWTPMAPSVAFGELVRALDGDACAELLSLVVALKRSPDAVDAWIEARTPNAAAEEEARSLFEGWPTLEDLGHRYARRVLHHVGGNRTRAADLMGVDRRTVGKLLRRP